MRTETANLETTTECPDCEDGGWMYDDVLCTECPAGERAVQAWINDFGVPPTTRPAPKPRPAPRRSLRHWLLRAYVRAYARLNKL